MSKDIDKWLRQIREEAKENGDPETELRAIELMVETERVIQTDLREESVRLMAQVKVSQEAQARLLVENLNLTDAVERLHSDMVEMQEAS